MDRALIKDLICPYCNGSFRIVQEVEGTENKLQYGLIECRCFKFPVVHGILLLSLSKGYGGAEEELQPYVPLQVAAIRYLERGDVVGLRGWLHRRMPLAADLVDGTAGTYLKFSARMAMKTEAARARYLVDQGRNESVGYPGLHAQELFRAAIPPGRLGIGRLPFYPNLRQAYHSLRAWLVPRQYELEQLSSFYVQRFFAPRVNALALQLGFLPLEDRIVSLCCGQGIFENIVKAYGTARQVVSVDGQFLNLLLVKHFVDPAGNYICHDIQFPLPFADGYFDGVFSSTCLPEIPAQRSLVSESLRVTQESGWSFFDSIFNAKLGDSRINELRHYRFCQNFFGNLSDYRPFFKECAGPGRSLAFSIPDNPRSYTSQHGWVFSDSDKAAKDLSSDEPYLSVLAVHGARFRGFNNSVSRPWMTSEHLSVSPTYAVTTPDGSTLKLTRNPALAMPAPAYAPTAFRGYAERVDIDLKRVQDTSYLLNLYCDGVLALMPRAFDSPSRLLSDLQMRSSAPRL